VGGNSGQQFKGKAQADRESRCSQHT
jgi:hypothetical protein